MGELKKILHVEDEPDILEITRMTLEAVGGLSVESCLSGVEALDKAKGFNPDLFLLDVMMPEMDGPTLLAKLRAMDHVRDVPAVFMTAKSQAHEIERFKQLGAVDVIVKPFDPMTVCILLHDIWNRVAQERGLI